ncbi:unnamed protein product, partial [Closterium sp. NIES-53]
IMLGSGDAEYESWMAWAEGEDRDKFPHACTLSLLPMLSCPPSPPQHRSCWEAETRSTSRGWRGRRRGTDLPLACICPPSHQSSSHCPSDHAGEWRCGVRVMDGVGGGRVSGQVPRLGGLLRACGPQDDGGVSEGGGMVGPRNTALPVSHCTACESLHCL